MPITKEQIAELAELYEQTMRDAITHDAMLARSLARIKFTEAAHNAMPALIETLDDLDNRSHQTVIFECGCVFKQDGLDDEPKLIQHCVSPETLSLRAELQQANERIAELREQIRDSKPRSGCERDDVPWGDRNGANMNEQNQERRACRECGQSSNERRQIAQRIESLRRGYDQPFHVGYNKGIDDALLAVDNNGIEAELGQKN